MGGKTTGKSYFKPAERDVPLMRRAETSTTARPPHEDSLAARRKPQRPVGWRGEVAQLAQHKFDKFDKFDKFASLSVWKRQRKCGTKHLLGDPFDSYWSGQ